MRNSIPVLSILILSLCAGEAFAANNVFYGKIAPKYVLGDVAIVASPDPVIQSGITHTAGKWSFDGLGSVGKGAGNELDASVFYDTKAGPVKLQFSGQYYFLNLHDGSLFDPSDDLIEVYADASIPLTHGRFTVAPMFRAIQMFGVDELKDATLVQPGVRGSFQAMDRLSFSGDLRDSINLTSKTSAMRFSGVAAWRATSTTTLKLGYDDTNKTPAVFSLGFAKTF
ncbi:MAG: hypothetical protein ABA06_03055 [Parcubacteria bacterium C7867-001]|nr:MAG: hypothetical protein ABA06_03055 [Parcubacteria bacterium C7867-001]